MISVIVTTYNQEKTISRTLDAILKQQCDEPFEVLIGDDCSKDDTVEICQKYTKQYPDKIKLFARPENLGVVDNYYTLVKDAHGEFFIDCAGDDEWCPGRLQLCLDIMRKYPNVVHVVTDAWNREDNNQVITESNGAKYPEGIIPGKEFMLDMLTRQMQQVFLGMMRRDVVLELISEYPTLFSGRTYLAEDKQVTTLLGTKGDTYFCPEKTFYYTIDNTDSIMHTNKAMNRFRFYGSILSMTQQLAKIANVSLWDMLPMYWLLFTLQWRQPLRWMSAKIFSH